MIGILAMIIVGITIIVGIGAKLYLGSSNMAEQAIEKVVEEVVKEETGIDVNLNDLDKK